MLAQGGGCSGLAAGRIVVFAVALRGRTHGDVAATACRLTFVPVWRCIRTGGAECISQRLGCRLLSRTIGRWFVGALEQWVVGENLLDLLFKLDGRELQQADRLLQLRRQRQVLR